MRLLLRLILASLACAPSANVLDATIPLMPGESVPALHLSSEEPREVVVTVAPVDGAGSRAFARIVRDGIAVEVDVGRGVEVGVTGRAVDVVLGRDTDPRASAVLTLHAAMGFGEGAHEAVRTRYLDGLDPGARRGVPVPPFAAAIASVRRQTGGITFVAPPVAIFVLDASGRVLRRESLPLDVDHPIALPAEAARVDVLNGDTAPIDASAQFALAL